MADDGLSGLAGGKDESLDDALSSLQMIEALLGGDTPEETPEVSFKLPLKTVMELLPPHYVANPATAASLEGDATITSDDLFQQLTRGKSKIAISVQRLVFSVSADLVTNEALVDTTTMVDIPLPLVVSALDPRVLMKMAQHVKNYNIADIPDPFADAQKAAALAHTKGDSPEPAEEPPTSESQPPSEPAPIEEPESAEPPVLDEEPKSTAPVPEEEPGKDAEVDQADELDEAEAEESEEAADEEPEEDAAAEESEEDAEVEQADEPDEEPDEIAAVEAAPAAVAATKADEPKESASRPAHGVGGPGGVDLNVAGEEVLATLDGMTGDLARAVVTYRSEHGPFANIFELGNVPNLGRKAFKQITGMAFTAKRRDRSDRLSKLLKLPVAELANLSSIARAVASRQGFAGCIISDDEGMPLADYRSGGTSEALSAVIPQLVKQVRDNMEIAGFPEIDCISVSAEGQMISMIGTGRVFLTYLHGSDKLTTGQLALVRKVAGELAWLLSHRGYVGD
jgi:DNA uptake protein ComE-like DNA-binding protein